MSSIQGHTRHLGFYGGVFLIAASILCLQILQTRLLSVMSWYFLAFFAISMAMLGMTIGAMLVYFFDKFFRKELIHSRVVQFSLCFAVSTVLCWLILISSVSLTEFSTPIMASLVWLKLIFVLSPPYIFGGIVISLALTRSPYPVGVVYAVDLIGAAAGCFAVFGLMFLMDGVSAIIAVAAMGGFTAILFKLDANAEETGAKPGSPPRFTGWKPIIIITVLISSAAIFNATVYPEGGRVMSTKRYIIERGSFDAIYWNSFSRINVGTPVIRPPFMWGASPKFSLDKFPPISQRAMHIDGGAGTTMMQYHGDRDELSFLQYDITNLAYSIRNQGRSAVIGVGGGRDVLSAHYFGFDSVTGVEINPIFIDNLKNRYADYNKVASIEGVRLVIDEARSWFARTDESFDLIQMSLIDTWAATGVGAFSLTENGLYTIEAWKHFMGRLNSDGVFTVSRWYSSADPGETGRLISLAKATLFELGVSEPNHHIVLAVVKPNLSTIIVSRAPFSEADLAQLRETSSQLEFDILFQRGSPPDNTILRAVYDAKAIADLYSIPNDSYLDYSPPTDDRPFFFNQLRLSKLPELLIKRDHIREGIFRGNLTASLVLAIIVFVSLAAVIFTIVIPALPATRRTAPRLVFFGTAFFLLIGLGFMFVEIGMMQRLSIFLGHPIYGLIIALAGIILATGMGSAVSVVLPLDTRRRIIIWSLLTASYIASLPIWFPNVVAALDGSGILLRGIISLAAIFPAGVALGVWFPTGMRLVQAIDTRPTPWFWAVNGAAGVFASGLAVATGTFISIDVTLWAAGLCYLLICPVALGLRATD